MDAPPPSSEENLSSSDGALLFYQEREDMEHAGFSPLSPMLSPPSPPLPASPPLKPLQWLFSRQRWLCDLAAVATALLSPPSTQQEEREEETSTEERRETEREKNGLLLLRRKKKECRFTNHILHFSEVNWEAETVRGTVLAALETWDSLCALSSLSLQPFLSPSPCPSSTVSSSSSSTADSRERERVPSDGKEEREKEINARILSIGGLKKRMLVILLAQSENTEAFFLSLLPQNTRKEKEEEGEGDASGEREKREEEEKAVNVPKDVLQALGEQAIKRVERELGKSSNQSARRTSSSSSLSPSSFFSFPSSSLSAATVGFFKWDLSSGAIFWSAGQCSLYGLAEESKFGGTIEDWLSFLPSEEERKRFLDLLLSSPQEQIEEAKHCPRDDKGKKRERQRRSSFFHVVRREDQGALRLRLTAELIRDKEGRPLELIGMNWRVDEREEEADREGGEGRRDDTSQGHSLSHGRKERRKSTPPRAQRVKEEKHNNDSEAHSEEERKAHQRQEQPTFFDGKEVVEVEEGKEEREEDEEEDSLSSSAVSPNLLALKEAERKLKIISDTLNLGTWEWDPETTELLWDDNNYQVHGLGREKYPNPYEAWASVVFPEDQGRVLEETEKAVLRGGEIISRCRIRTPAGEVKHLATRGIASLSSENSATLKVHGVTWDVTQEEERRRERERRQKELEILFGSMHEGLIVHDAMGKVVTFNSAAQRILRHSTSEGLKSTTLDSFVSVKGMLSEDGAPLSQEEWPISITLRTGKPVINVIVGVTFGSGDLSWLSVTTTPLYRAEDDNEGDKQEESEKRDKAKQEQRDICPEEGAPQSEVRRPYRVVSTFVDITERKKAERELLERSRELETEKLKFEGFVYALNRTALVSITDGEGTVTFANGKFIGVTGQAAHQVMNRLHPIFRATDQSESFKKEHWPAIVKGKVWHGIICKRHPENAGKELWLDTTVVPFFSSSSSVSSLSSSSRDVVAAGGDGAGGDPGGQSLKQATQTIYFIQFDITEQKELEQQLVRSREAERNANNAKTIFLATMSHEMRTPLNGVIGMCSLLAESPLSEEQREQVDTITSSGRILLSLIDDILDFSKIEAGKMELELVDFDVGPYIRDVCKPLRHVAERKSIFFHLEVPQTSVRLIGDDGRIGQVINNLAGNAIKFTSKGGVTVKAEVTDLLGRKREKKIEKGEEKMVEERGGGSSVMGGGREGEKQWAELFLQVTDTGIGIPSAAKGKLFKSFTQADSRLGRQYGGTGLGLSISKKLIELMGGTIGFDSKLGVGSTFWAKIPLQKSEGRGGRDGGTGPLLPGEERERGGLGRIRSAGNVFDAEKGQPNGSGASLLSSFPPRLNAKEGEKTRGERAEQERDAPSRTSSSGSLSSNRETELLAVRAGQRILVAEDNAINQKIISKMLSRLGFPYDIAENGLQALSLLEKRSKREEEGERSYSLVLMDCEMPEMDGYEASRVIRKHDSPRIRAVPVVALTANAVQGVEQSCRDCGMDGYLTKPITLQRLGDTIDKFLRRQ